LTVSWQLGSDHPRGHPVERWAPSQGEAREVIAYPCRQRGRAALVVLMRWLRVENGFGPSVVTVVEVLVDVLGAL
jgi:hypothetical protein